MSARYVAHYLHLPPVPAGASTLVDTFTGGTLNTALWTQANNAGVTGGQTGNRYEFAIANHAWTYSELQSALTFNLTASNFHLQLAAAGSQSIGSLEAYPIIVRLDTSNEVFFVVAGGFIAAWKKVAGVSTLLASTAYSAVTHAWLRVREAAGTTYWDTSADATTWTTLHSVSNPIVVTAVQLVVKAGEWADEAAGATTVAVDNVGAAPMAVTVTDTAGLTDAAARVVAAVRTASDVAGLTDAATAAQSLTRTVSDTAGLTDSASKALTAARTASDSAGLTDTVSRALAATRTVADAAGLIDTASATVAAVRTVADGAGLTDAASVELAGVRAVADLAGLSDAVTRTVSASRTAADIAGLVDAATTVMSRTRTVTDLAGLTDSTTTQLVLARAITDTAGLTDSVTAVLVTAGPPAVGAISVRQSYSQSVTTSPRVRTGVTLR